MKELTPIIFVIGGALIAAGSHWITAWFMHRKFRSQYTRGWNAARNFISSQDRDASGSL